MKKLVISILAIVLVITAVTGVTFISAEENTTYYQINKEVILFDGADTEMTVVLPEGYWLKKESVDTIRGHIVASYNGYTVRFKQSDENKLTQRSDFKADTVLQYVHISKLNPKFSGLALMKDTDLSIGTGVTLTEESSLTFLSRTTNSKGKVVYLVMTDDKKAGYIDASLTSDSGIIVPNWTPPAEPETPPSTDTDKDNNGSGTTIGPNENNGEKLPTNNVVKIVLIVAICLLAVILVFLIFKPTRTKKSGRYRLDDDDRDDAYIDDRY